MKQEILYHIMIDRFFPIREEDADGSFKGGCLRSVIDHLDYIQGLGMTGIMLTPFYKTAAYHGYHIVDFEQVDPHFGTKEDLHELVDKVHQRGMTIVADFVANHSHKTCRLFADGRHKDWFVFGHDGKYKCFAGITDLPMFNTKNKEVQSYLTQRALDLCRMGFDAIRLDHAAGPSYGFWNFFCKSIKEKFPKVSLIGEVWGKLDFKPHNYIRYYFNCLRYNVQEARQLEYVGILNGVLDFCYQELLCKAVHSGKSITNNLLLHEKVKAHFSRYPSSFKLWLFLDNHDMNRFLFECKGNKLLFHEAIDFTVQWNRPFLIYYGTEQNMMNDKDLHSVHFGDEMVREPIVRE